MPSISTNRVINKPVSAFWTSTFLGKEKHRELSDWNIWASESGMLKRNDFFLTPKDGIRVLEIDSYPDYLDAKKLGASKNDAIDFGWYAQNGFDGIHVTERAIMECRCAEFEQSTSSIMLSLWDAESTCWFHLHWIAEIASHPKSV